MNLENIIKYKEQNIFMATKQLINHCINLVPYCMILK